MKKKIMCLPLLAVLLLTGCEKRLFHFIATINQTPVFNVDQTGAFKKSIQISSSLVRSQLDIPEDARITQLDIESLSLRVEVKSGNQASRLSVSGTILDVGQQRQKQMFKDFPVVLVGVNAPFVGLNSLIADGISELRGKLEGYVKNLDTGSFFIEVTGDSNPPGQRVLVDLHLVIKATVKYDQCVEVPQLFSSGEECTE
ncbi:MAG: hypothetical protein ONB46_00510 [candidate division KSB1 bacterium]|nr:hypothetical protein [candidate division KSB1 bacterium]MDZ7364674.1 hypothetical protein [candidate division KSB1 bacterium]MDZ7402578.1 hypothetical protein [candidate division KSB1 bacterium]